MNFFLILFKLPLVAFVISCFFIIGILNQLLLFFSKAMRQKVAQRNTQWACILCNKILNIQADYQIRSQPKGALLICNHLSYIDVLVIASKTPTLFVTSLEMKKTPFLGWITQLGECLYVDRKSHKNLNFEVDGIQKTLARGHNVLLFPEATTSNGIDIKPFRSSLLKVADESLRPLFSYCIKYTHRNHDKMTSEDQLEMAWFDNKGFLPHLLMLMKQTSIQCTLYEIESLIPAHFSDRKKLTEHLYQNTTQAYIKL